MSNQTQISRREKVPRSQFGLRSLLAVMAGLAVVSLSVRSLVQIGITPFDVGFLTVPWAVGSLVGIIVASRSDRSTLVGGILGAVGGGFLSYAFDMVVCPLPLRRSDPPVLRSTAPVVSASAQVEWTSSGA
jgi:hypothetical protein